MPYGAPYVTAETSASAETQHLVTDINNALGRVTKSVNEVSAQVDGIDVTPDDGSITNTLLADMATQTFKGRNTAGTGSPEDLSMSTALTMLSAARPAFSANKNGTNQTISANSITQVTFGTESFDVGSHYDTSTSKWTPPAGVVLLSALIYFDGTDSASGGDNYHVYLYKNGSAFLNSYVIESLADNVNSLVSSTWIDIAGGSDTYEIRVRMGRGGAGNQVVGGDAQSTVFMGAML
jgi:hypothetical protein